MAGIHDLLHIRHDMVDFLLRAFSLGHTLSAKFTAMADVLNHLPGLRLQGADNGRDFFRRLAGPKRQSS